MMPLPTISGRYRHLPAIYQRDVPSFFNQGQCRLLPSGGNLVFTLIEFFCNTTGQRPGSSSRQTLNSTYPAPLPSHGAGPCRLLIGCILLRSHMANAAKYAGLDMRHANSNRRRCMGAGPAGAEARVRGEARSRRWNGDVHEPTRRRIKGSNQAGKPAPAAPMASAGRQPSAWSQVRRGRATQTC